MRRTIFALLLAWAAASPAQEALGQQSAGASEQQILLLDDEMAAAMGGDDFRHYDLAAADRLVAPDAIFIGPDGKANFNRAQVFGGMRDRATSLTTSNLQEK